MGSRGDHLRPGRCRVRLRLDHRLRRPIQRLRLDRGYRRLPDAPASGRGGGDALPPPRDRPDHQPHAVVRGGDRDPRCRLRRGHPPVADRAGGDHRQPGHPRRDLDARRVRALPARSAPCPPGGRPALRPGPLRRRADGRCLRRAAALGDRHGARHGDLRATVADAVAPSGLDIWLRAGRPSR